MNSPDPFFDRRAETWDEDNPVAEYKIERVLSHCGLQRGHRVLDVGTGTGRLIPYILQEVGPGGWICGLDPSPGMLTVARAKHPHPNVVFTEAPAEHVPHGDESFNTVICHAVFPHFQDPAEAVEELYRVLLPHGRLVIAHTNGRDEINRRHRNADAEVESDILPPVREVVGLLTAVGFDVRESIDEQDFYLVSGTKFVAPNGSGRR